MMDTLGDLDTGSLSLLTMIGRRADKEGVAAYLVGGPVRDMLLGHPSLDLDVVLEANAMLFARRLLKETDGALRVYPAFKTATVTMPDGRALDLATARKETYARPGAFPKVSPSGVEDDLFRRDFTVNALAVSINSGAWGKVVDPYGGLKDIKKKKIRVLHKLSFIDDPTRILRAVRFKERLGFTYEAATFKLMEGAIAGGALETITPQRYKKEYDKILKEKKSRAMIAAVNAMGALQRNNNVTHRKSQ